MNVDLTEAEMRLILTRIGAAEARGVSTPEDQSVKAKLVQMVGLLTPRSQEDMVRSYTDPTARR